MLIGVQLAPEKDFQPLRPPDRPRRRSPVVLRRVLEPEVVRRDLPGQGEDARPEAVPRGDGVLREADAEGRGVGGNHRGHRAGRGHASTAIDYIAGLGAFPTVCVFRPTVGADMEAWPPPKYDEMRAVMLHVYEACRRNWIPIGAAPNIEVSIVVNPDDAALLAPRDGALLGLRGVPADGAGGGGAAVRVAAAGAVATNSRRYWRRSAGRAGLPRRLCRGLTRNPVYSAAIRVWHSSCSGRRQVTEYLHD